MTMIELEGSASALVSFSSADRESFNIQRWKVDVTANLIKSQLIGRQFSFYGGKRYVGNYERLD